MRTWTLIAGVFLIAASLCAQPKAVAVSVEGVVHPVTVEIIRHALQQARDEHAQVVLVRLNTPGGLLNATRDIVHEMLASTVPVVTYVTPSGGRAASAGFFLLEAGDVAAMAPGTNTGAASPVLMGQEMDQVMRRKVENDTAALLRSVTTRRGRNTELAESAVREAKAFTDKEALDNKLIDLIAASEQELLSKLDGREITLWDGRKVTLRLAGVVVEETRLSLRERVISAIADPNIGFILLILGALGLYIEFSSPGLIFPGVAGGLMLLLGLASLSVLPINWLGAALLALALAMFVLEAKFHSHGILGTGGTVAMVLGALLLVNGPPAVRIHLSTALGVALPFALITMFLVSIVVRARANKVLTGTSSMIHEVGVARTALEPEGKILVRGEYWDAVSSVPVPAGMRVRVVDVQGITLRVEPV